MFGWNPSTGEWKPTGYVQDLVGANASTPARLSVAFILICIVFFCVLTAAAGRRWDRAAAQEKETKP